MEIEFSVHAIGQLQIRSRITRAMVLETLHNADQILQSYRNRELYRKRYGDKWLEIVAVKEDNKFTVITQYFLDSES